MAGGVFTGTEEAGKYSIKRDGYHPEARFEFAYENKNYQFWFHADSEPTENGSPGKASAVGIDTYLLTTDDNPESPSYGGQVPYYLDTQNIRADSTGQQGWVRQSTGYSLHCCSP